MNQEKGFRKFTHSKLFLPLMSLAVVLLVNLIKSPAFFAITIKKGVLYGRLIDVLNRGSEIAILAVGQTLVVAVSAGTDISVGSVMSLSACFTTMLLAGFGVNTTTTIVMPLALGILAGILMGGLCGAMNGALVAKLKIQPMVATLILFNAARAIGLLLNNNQITYIRYEPYKWMGNFLPHVPIPTPIIVAAIVIIVVSLILNKTALGLFIQSVGINSRASRIVGLNSTMICFLCYVICGLCAGTAGMVASSRIYCSDSASIGLNYEMDAILAVALGGNSLGGGRFNMAGSIIGAYTIQAITTTLLSFGVSTDQAPVVKAVIVIAIVVVQSPVFQEYLENRRNRKASALKGAA